MISHWRVVLFLISSPPGIAVLTASPGEAYDTCN